MILQKQTDSIEADTFALLLKKLEFDQQSYRVWMGKMSGHDAAVAHQKADWVRKLVHHNRQAAAAYMAQNMSLDSYPADGIGMQVIKENDACKCLLQQRLQLDADGVVCCPGFCKARGLRRVAGICLVELVDGNGCMSIVEHAAF